MTKTTPFLEPQSSAAKVQAFTNEAIGKINGDFTNSAVVRKIGGAFHAKGRRDIAKPADFPNNTVDENTLFAEGSIGKVRYAGLAYMLEQAGVFDEFGEKGLKQNAKEFFSDGRVKEFLDKKYPDFAQRAGRSAGDSMQKEILNLFSKDNEKATLTDLLTHHAGVGDTTRDALKTIETFGINHQFTLAEIIDAPIKVVPRDGGKPRAQAGGNVSSDNLPIAQFGKHEYSNLGYQVMAVAMEAAYFVAKGEEKTYQQLTEDFMLHPCKGRAASSGLSFDDTKFPENLSAEDNVIVARYVENIDGKPTVTTTNNCSSANAAGGIFTSANDSVKFFTEFFKGFPGPVEPGKEPAVNPFFTKETIDKMQQEWQSHAPANQVAINEAIASGEEPPARRFQGPGFTVDVDANGTPINYGKGGGTPGFISNLEFNPKTGEAAIAMIAQENVTTQAKQAAVNSVAGAVESKAGKDGHAKNAAEKFEGLASKLAPAKDEPPPRKWVDKFPAKNSHVAEVAAKIEGAKSDEGQRR